MERARAEEELSRRACVIYGAQLARSHSVMAGDGHSANVRAAGEAEVFNLSREAANVHGRTLSSWDGAAPAAAVQGAELEGWPAELWGQRPSLPADGSQEHTLEVEGDLGGLSGVANGYGPLNWWEETNAGSASQTEDDAAELRRVQEERKAAEAALKRDKKRKIVDVSERSSKRARRDVKV